MKNYQDRLDYLRFCLKKQHVGVFHAAPTELLVNRVFPKKILIVGSCGAEAWGFHHKKYDNVECDYIFTNGLDRLPEKTQQELGAYDFQLIQLPLRFVLPDSALWDSQKKNDEEIQQLFQQAKVRLHLLLEKHLGYQESLKILTFVANFYVPQFNPLGRFSLSYDLRNPQHFISELNRYLEQLIKDKANTALINIDSLASSFGKRYILEDSVNIFSHGSVLPGHKEDESRIEKAPPFPEHVEIKNSEFHLMMWNDLIAAWRTSIQNDQVKLVVVDLDDTLWHGVIGDLSTVGADIGEGWPIGLIEALAFFKMRGGMLAIISKNDHEIATKGYNKVHGKRFSIDNFVSLKINFRPKHENMAEILSAINITPKSVVFIDDNPVEREQMQAAFPDMRVLHGFHYYWRRIILNSPETQVRSITAESAGKTELVKKQFEREELKSQLDRTEFLKSLDINVSIGLLNKSSPTDIFNRCFELLNKTNQFNTTGRRWTFEQFSSFSSENHVFYFSAEDKFSAYGLVGVVLISGSAIEQFVMSCRVAGLGIEIGVMKNIVNYCRHRFSITNFTALFINTNINVLCASFYKICGFTDNDGQYVLSGDVSSESVYGQFSTDIAEHL